MNSLDAITFYRSSRGLLLKKLFRKYGWKALYKQFRFNESRSYSRGLITRYSPEGTGLEVGVGEWTIAPVNRTLLSDFFQDHASNPTIAQAFFSADAIPFEDGTFSFLLSEHVLEHLPNTLQTLREWRRVLRHGGVLYLFLPHPERTFDRLRTPTPFAHFLEDEKRAVGPEEDFHYAEWEEKVIRQGLAPHYAGLTKDEVLRTNALHRHVFVPDTVAQLLKEVSFDILEVIPAVPDRLDSFCVIARKA